MKNVLFVASECVPFIKTGGLADVVGSLPKCFNKDEFDVRVIIPKYMCMKEEYKNQLEYITHFYMDLSWRSQYVGVLHMMYEGIHYYFIDNEYYLAGPRPYGNIYEDIEKFAFFSKAALSALPLIGFKPDIVHCHDWQTGLIPVFLKEGKTFVKVEVQFRTIAMDFWASVDHKLRYKKNVTNEEEIMEKLRICADSITAIDEEMQKIRNMIEA